MVCVWAKPKDVSNNPKKTRVIFFIAINYGAKVRKKYENMQYTDKRQLHYAKPKGSVSPEEGKERGDSITEAFLEEFPQGKMNDSILVALCQ